MYNTSKKITNKEAKNIVANKSIIWVDDSDIVISKAITLFFRVMRKSEEHFRHGIFDKTCI